MCEVRQTEAMSMQVLRSEGLSQRSQSVVLAAIGLLVCAVLALMNFVAVGLSCDDSSRCARGTAKDGTYQGTLIDPSTKRPRANVIAPLYFPSIDKVAGRLRTDGAGRYCVVWAKESVYPTARLGPTDESLRVAWQPLAGADPPVGCQTFAAEIPWNRALGADGRYESRIVYLLVGLAALLLVSGATITQRKAMLAGLACAAAAAGTWLVLWA